MNKRNIASPPRPTGPDTAWSEKIRKADEQMDRAWNVLLCVMVLWFVAIAVLVLAVAWKIWRW